MTLGDPELRLVTWFKIKSKDVSQTPDEGLRRFGLINNRCADDLLS